jgi:hypothetical protein
MILHFCWNVITMNSRTYNRTLTVINILPLRISVGVIVNPIPSCTSNACSGADPARAPCFHISKEVNHHTFNFYPCICTVWLEHARVTSFNDCSIIINVLLTQTSPYYFHLTFYHRKLVFQYLGNV